MKRRNLLLLSPDPTDAPGGPPAPPPAAQTVIDSPAVEGDAAEIVRLRRENDETSRKLKARETRVSELEDENRQLKAVPTPPQPPKQKKDWLEGNTFFG